MSAFDPAFSELVESTVKKFKDILMDPHELRHVLKYQNDRDPFLRIRQGSEEPWQNFDFKDLPSLARAFWLLGAIDRYSPEEDGTKEIPPYAGFCLEPGLLIHATLEHRKLCNTLGKPYEQGGLAFLKVRSYETAEFLPVMNRVIYVAASQYYLAQVSAKVPIDQEKELTRTLCEAFRKEINRAWEAAAGWYSANLDLQAHSCLASLDFSLIEDLLAAAEQFELLRKWAANKKEVLNYFSMPLPLEVTYKESQKKVQPSFL